MNRRGFLGALARTAAGLIVADSALDLIAEPRRYWFGADFGGRPVELLTNEEILRIWREVHAPLRAELSFKAPEWYGIITDIEHHTRTITFTVDR